jgi:hypothetical protein
MRRLAAVVAHELSLRRQAPLQALALGLVPWLITLMPLRHPEDVRFAAALSGSLLLGVITALALGTTTLASELKSERLGFFFAQPLGGGAIWAGKLLGVSLIAESCMLLVLLPTALLEPAPFLTRELLTVLLVAALAIPGLVVVGHVLGSSLHGRNAWLALELAALVGASLWIVASYDLLRREAALEVFWIAAAVTLVAAALGVAFATWLQVTRGRTSLSRSDRVLSIGVATCLVAAAAGLWLFGRWATQPTPADLLGVKMARPRGEDWLEIHGAFRWRPGYHPALLVNRESGAHVVLPGFPRRKASSLTTASNDRTLVWLEYSEDYEGWALWSLDLQSQNPQAIPSGAQGTEIPLWPALSPDGQRIASLALSPLDGVPLKLIVRELSTGRVLVARSLPAEVRPAESSVLAFEDDRHLFLVTTVWREGGYRAVRYGLAIDSGELDLEVEIPELVASRESALIFSPDGEVVLGPGALYSTRTGERLASRDEAEIRKLLNGERFVAYPKATDADPESVLYHLDRSRLQVRSRASGTIDLPDLGGSSVIVVGECDDGALVIAAQREAGLRAAYWLVHPETGSCLALGADWQTVVPGSHGTILAIDRQSGLVELDTTTGAPTVLVEGQLNPTFEWERQGLSWWEQLMTGIGRPAPRSVKHDS